MPVKNNGYVRKGQSFQIGDRVVKLPHQSRLLTPDAYEAKRKR